MWDTIWNYLSDNYPFVLILALACWLTWKAKGMYDSSKEVKEKVDALPCEQHKADISLVKQSNLKLNDIASSVRKIEEWILRMDINAMSDLVRKCSPYQLTEAGQKMLEDSEAKHCVDTHLDKLLQALEETHPMTAYDVERNALNVLSSLTDDPMFNDIKDFIYNSPSHIDIHTSEGVIPVEISMQRLLMIMSVYLRDIFFQRHEELDTSAFPPKMYQ